MLTKFNVLRLNLRIIRYLSSRHASIKSSYFYQDGRFRPSDFTVGKALDDAADKSGDEVAVISSQQKITRTFSQFRIEAERLASGFLHSGLNPGDKIGICSPNCYEWVLVQFAAAKAGLILVNINPAYQASELEYCLRKVQCNSLVLADSFKTQDFYSIMCKILPNLPNSSPNELVNSKIPSLKNIIMISKETKRGTLNICDVLNCGNKESDTALAGIEKRIQFDDPVNIQFTSGTTGAPKGAVLTHHNVINNSLLAAQRLGYDLQKSILCCQVPLFHCFGSVTGILTTVLSKATCVFPCAGFDVEESLKTIEQQRCTIIYGTPTMYVDLLNKYKSKKFNIQSLKRVVIGGSGPTESLLEEIKHVLNIPHLHIAYGSTENSPAVAINEINEDFQSVAKMYLKPIDLIELKVIDDKNQVVPIGTKGELCVRGHNVFEGYWDDKEKTDEVVDNTRWYHTGDISVMNEDGCVKIVGRKKDIIIRGGENIDPLEIENFLSSHPDVTESQVVGVPDKRMGEEVCAWVILEQGRKMKEDDIKQFCKGKISHFKIPRYVLFVDNFPKTESGKIKKYEIIKSSIQIFNLQV